MNKNKNLLRLLLKGRKLFAVLLVISFVFVMFGFVRQSPRVQAAAGINQQINYQARLLNSQGATVPDGTYNMEFKIYQDGNGCVSGGSSPCSGTLKWTETRQNISSQGVTVTNGYFSVNLGSVTAFAGNVDWNQDTLWLSINIGGTSGGASPTYDGEMLPFKRLASTPYALNSKYLGGLASTSFIQLAQGVQTDSSTTNPSIFINKTGSTAAILELQKAGSDVLLVDNTGLLTLSGNQIFTTGSDHTISVTTAASNTNGNALTVAAAAGNGSGNGGLLTLSGGAAGSTGNGEGVSILGTTSSSANGANGGNISITAGDGTLFGGASSHAGNVTITSGGTVSTAATGSSLTLAGSVSGFGVSFGGLATLQGGTGDNLGPGGAVAVKGGTAVLPVVAGR